MNCDAKCVVKRIQAIFYTDQTYCTAVSNNHNSQQLKYVSKPPSKLTKAAKVAQKLCSTTKILRSRDNVKIAQKLSCARSQFLVDLLKWRSGNWPWIHKEMKKKTTTQTNIEGVVQQTQIQGYGRQLSHRCHQTSRHTPCPTDSCEALPVSHHKNGYHSL